MQPAGYCQCGCGRRTPLAKRDRPDCGWVKGQPIRYIHGHHARKLEARYAIEDRGFTTPCWIWQLATDKDGYGIENNRRAHRVYYEQYVGSIPDGLTIDHLCRVSPCVNPTHLEAVTIQENLRRRDVALGRRAA